MKRFYEEAHQLIQLNSNCSEGNEALSNYVSTLMQEWGLKTQIQPVTHSFDEISRKQFNVIGILGDPLVDRKIKKGLLLASHLDTGPPGLSEHWNETGKNPFELVHKDSRLYGLGAANAKLDFLCKLHAAGRYREKKLKMPIYVVGSCGKEFGMFGTRYLLKALTLNPLHVIVSEPSELKLMRAQKSLQAFKINIGFRPIERDARGFNRRIQLRTFGRSCHASTPQLGVNAILAMLDFLQRAVDNGFELRFIEFGGGDLVSKVPDAAFADFCLTSHQLEDFKRFFREMLKIAGRDKVFQVDLGGIGEAGIRFLPETVFPCLSEIVGLFEKIGADLAKVKDNEFQPPYSTQSFGKIKQIQSGLELTFDLRLLPSLSVQDIETHLKEGIQKIAKAYPILNLSIQRSHAVPGLDLPADSPWIQTCRDALVEIGHNAPEIIKSSTATEATFYHQSAYDCLAFGPGKIQGNSHSPNEFVEIKELEKAIQFYEKIIERTCL